MRHDRAAFMRRLDADVVSRYSKLVVVANFAGSVKEDSVAEAVERYTVRPLPEAPRDPEHIVVTLLDGDIAEAFETARHVAEREGAVRLVGHGVTLPATWPSWVRQQPGLVLTELGAYRAGNILDATADLRTKYLEWIEQVFAPAAPKGAVGDVYYAPAVLRMFQAVFETQVFAGGLVALHPDAQFHLIGQERRSFEAARKTSPRSRDKALPAVLLAAWAAGCAFSLVECTRLRIDAAWSFEELDKRAAEARGKPEPTLWLGLVPDWYRINKHLLDAGALPELRAGRRLGVLLLGTLRRGMRDEANLRAAVDRDKLWPGFDWLRDELGACTVAQAVQPRKTRDFIAAMGDFVRASAKVAVGMARNPEPLQAIAGSVGTFPVVRRAVAAATLDVARSMLAERAAREVIGEHEMRDRVVVFAAANAPGYTSVETVLRRAGAVTVEHTHGSGGSAWYGGNECSAQYRCIWTHAEEHVLAGRRQCIVAGMPQTLELRNRTPGAPRRVLLLSNYLHRDRPYKAMPHEPFQVELLRVAELLRAKLGDDLEFRWRPHPADEPAAVERLGARFSMLAISRGRTLAEDLDECDVLVSGQSTALIEAIVGKVPFFVQVLPELVRELSWVPPERRFFRAEDLVPAFLAWVEASRRGDPEASAADARARRALFGPTERPRSLHEGLASIAGSPAASLTN